MLQNIVLGPAGPTGYCGFPVPFKNMSTPECFVAFFNSEHPKTGYEHIVFLIILYGLDSDIEDLSKFPVGGGPYLWTSGGIRSNISIWNNRDPLTEVDSYHSLAATLSSYCIEDGKGIYITRESLNSWLFRIEQQVYDLSEYYTWAEPDPNAKGKPKTILSFYTPVEAQAELSFTIRLIKNPN
jgi:hypothetical protein